MEVVLSVAPSTTGQQHEKLRELVRDDFFNFADVEGELSGFDGCFYCLGVSSAGMSEEPYHRVTFDMTMAAAETLVKLNPGMTFIYVSGTGTDATEIGPVMWARVKGKTENALRRLPFKAAYMFRPGVIQPLHGITSKTKSYRILYELTRPLLPVLKAIFPSYITTTEQVGRAMLKVAKIGYPTPLLENKDINRL